MLSFAKFKHFRLCKSHTVFSVLSAIRTGVFSKEFLSNDDSLTLFVFCYSYGIFLNDVKLGIFRLITNMALKIQNDVIIRKTIKIKYVNISAGR